MKFVDVIIGANYGDEGKGLVTSFRAKSNGFWFAPVLNVLNNGGAQRGHTVEVAKNDKIYRHIFHHFGSGTFHNAITYFSEYFIINPMIFKVEYIELVKMKEAFDSFNVMNKIYRDSRCQWSTPYDAIVNQASEIVNNHKEGSCGLGIWETVKRYRHTNLTIDFDLFMNYSEEEKISYLHKIRNYYEKECEERGLFYSEKFKKIFYSEGLIHHFIDDCQFMFDKTIMVFNCTDVFDKFDRIIFENAQGLCIGSPGWNAPYTTPSFTGLKNIVDLFNKYDIKDMAINVIYVTRTYLTRHGKGPLPGECDKKLISDQIKPDTTNVFNEWQKNFRYAPLNIKELRYRVEDDFRYFLNDKNKNGYTKIFAFTHNDEVIDDNLIGFRELLNDYHVILRFKSPVC